MSKHWMRHFGADFGANIFKPVYTCFEFCRRNIRNDSIFEASYCDFSK